MKILFLTDNLDYRGGWGRYASDLVGGIAELGYQTIVLTKQRIPNKNYLKKIFNILGYILRIRKLSKDCDIIHALDGYPFGVLATIANIGRRKKLVITGQGTYAIEPFYHRFSAGVLKWAYKRANGVIAISDYTKLRILDKVSSLKIEVIEHGINLSKFFRPRVNSPDRYILGVGALKSRKGYHISIPAFALAKKKIPDLRYKIIGNQNDAIYFNSLKKIVTDSGVENDVVFIENISDKELGDLYAGAQLFILTSVNDNNNFEGFGLVFLEAAAAGLPVIGTKRNGISSAVREGYNGFLVEQGDINKTADAIIKLIGDERLNEKFSLCSYNWAKEHTIKNMAKRYLNFYQNLFSKLST